MQIGQIGPGQRHAVHQLFHLFVASQLDVCYLLLVAVAGRLLPKEEMEQLGVASPQDVAETRLIGLIAGWIHRCNSIMLNGVALEEGERETAPLAIMRRFRTENSSWLGQAHCIMRPAARSRALREC